MLYDWYSYDNTTGKYVYQMADDDLTRLKNSGYNLVHLYLWDQKLLRDASPNASDPEPAGFMTAPLHPSDSYNSQWAALNDFVTKAENKGLFVALHFASGKLLSDASAGADPEAASTEFTTRAGAFIQYLNSTNQHKNVLLWGMPFAFVPVAGDTNNNWSKLWQKCYKKLDDIARQHSPSPGIVGLLGANLGFDLKAPSSNYAPESDVIPRGSGYQWDWQTSQRSAQTMRDLLSEAYGYTKDPDVYMMQLYHANSWDLLANLNSLISGVVQDGLPVPAAKIFVVEFATSSSLNTFPNGNGYPAYGDKQTPTTTTAGHAQWLTNTLCAYRLAGLQKYDYWSMYDPYTMWSGHPWYKTGQDLAWNGFWGLVYESGVDKPSWSILTNFYSSDFQNITCPAPQNGSVPMVSLTPGTGYSNTSYFTLAQPVRLTWTASDVGSMTLSRPFDGSYSCNKQQRTRLLSSTLLTGSCAYTTVGPFYATGSYTTTLTGFNGVGGSPRSASTTVTVGDGPVLTAITDANNTSTINAYDWITLWGDGFSVTGGNSVKFTRPGYPDVWLYDGDGYGFWNESYQQINAELGGRLAPGTWTGYVKNGYSGTPSATLSITVYP